MGNVEVTRAKDDVALAQMAADRWLSTLNPDQRYCAAFSGGRIAVKFFRALAAHPKHTVLLRPQIHFFFADERCVPPEHPDSNFRLMKEHLADPLQICANQIHRIRGELAPSVAAQKAAQDLLKNCERLAMGIPVFDMVFLGMGEDGHIASIFPGDPEIDSRQIYRAVTAPKPPPDRITLGLEVIVHATHACVLVSGVGKENALRESLDGSGQTPLASVVRGRSKTIVLTDIRSEE